MDEEQKLTETLTRLWDKEVLLREEADGLRVLRHELEAKLGRRQGARQMDLGTQKYAEHVANILKAEGFRVRTLETDLFAGELQDGEAVILIKSSSVALILREVGLIVECLSKQETPEQLVNRALERHQNGVRNRRCRLSDDPDVFVSTFHVGEKTNIAGREARVVEVNDTMRTITLQIR